MSLLSLWLVPESDSLLQQLMLWLRHRLLQLPVFANVTLLNDTSWTDNADVGVSQLVANQVRLDSAYFAAFCCIQLLAILAPALLCACVWRRRRRRQRRRRRRMKRPQDPEVEGRVKPGSREVSVYAISGLSGFDESSSDRCSVSTCASDTTDAGGHWCDSSISDSDIEVSQHRCLVLSMLVLLLLLLATAAVSVALLIDFWNSGNQLQSRMLTESNRTATFRASTAQLVSDVNRLIDDLIESSNATLIDEFQANFYVIQSFFNGFARYIIEQLFDLLKLQPVLVQLEAFISKIESVEKIQSQAKVLAADLTSVKAELDDLRSELNSSCSKLCNSASYFECPNILASLSNLKLQVSPSLVQFDSLTTVITFMRQRGINVTQMRSDFIGTYASINQSLRTIDAEVNKLLNSVTVGIANEFGKIKNSSASLTASLSQTADSESVWSVVRDARTYFIIAVVLMSLALLPFYVFAVLLGTDLVRCLSWLLSLMSMELRDHRLRSVRLTDLNSLDAGPERIGGFPVSTVSAADLRRYDERRAKLRKYRQHCLGSFRQLSGSSRTYACGVLAVSIVTTLAFSLPVLAYYATSVADVRLCRYLRTSEGRATLDANLDSALLQHLWPGVTNLLEKSLQLPIPFDFSKRPNQLFTRLSTQCDNSSVSLFTALQMMNVINLTAFVYSPTVQQNLDYGKNMLHAALAGLAPETVLSADLRSIGESAEVSALGSLIDEELSRIDLLNQLDQPLLKLDAVALTDAIDRLADASSTTSAAVIAKHYNNELRSQTLSKLSFLQRRVEILTAVINATATGPSATSTIQRLAANIAGYKAAFGSPASVKAAADGVYDATVGRYLPPLVQLLDPMRERILQRLLPCLGFQQLVESGSALACSEVIESSLSVALALLLSLVALLLAACVFLGLLLQASGFCCILRGCGCCCGCNRDCSS
ncbi:hypothetical protein BOX15_Mlig014022g1 [Macrostomum lignano]|uniref:Prominin n=1 Tax=Macrostomum lignano TaxID=282301 RepID=A0A267GNJ0_9PLAT|nr:hypothetical protein BOX15_Mlig014022g2 [Macrostomum lignano]PAA87601.1 hypothetical protein BOX15_Mlig014022g1 [Macrostomum lignano]